MRSDHTLLLSFTNAASYALGLDIPIPEAYFAALFTAMFTRFKTERSRCVKLAITVSQLSPSLQALARNPHSFILLSCLGVL